MTTYDQQLITNVQAWINPLAK